VVAKDSDMDMVAAAAGSVPQALDALYTETLAMMHVIDMANRQGISRIVLATDPKVLQTAMTSRKYDLAQLGALFGEIKFLLQTLFIDSKVVYVPRTCSKNAHTLIALGMAWVPNDHQEWFERVPIDVSKSLYGEFSLQV
jgi:ADP-dependent phosphofructokinase/glucokinase